MTAPFSPHEIAALSAEIDRQLRDLSSPAHVPTRAGGPSLQAFCAQDPPCPSN